MAIVFEANYSKKIGLPNYSSHQYNLTIRVEFADINEVPQESERLYELLQSCVDREIQKTGFLPDLPNNGNGNGHHPVNQNGSNGHNGNGNGDYWKCSPKQKELVLKIVEENQIDKNEVELLAQDRFNASVKNLNTMQMSGIISELLEKYPGEKPANNGNRRYGANGNRQAAGRGAR